MKSTLKKIMLGLSVMLIFAVIVRAEYLLNITNQYSNLSVTNKNASWANKPTMVFVYSNKCYSSRAFTRKVLNNETIKNLHTSKINRINMDVATLKGRIFAQINDVFELPTVFFVSNDETIKYRSKLSLDSIKMQ